MEDIRPCSFCGWAGADVEPMPDDPEGNHACIACMAAMVIVNHVETVAEMNPAHLIPIIRACTAQTVSAIVVQVLEYAHNAMEIDKLQDVIDSLKNKVSTDPN